MPEDNKIAELEQQLALMQQMLEQRQEKPQSRFKAKAKEEFQQIALNSIQDIPSTLLGLGSSIGIIAMSWPNVDATTLLLSGTIGGQGIMANNKVKKNAYVDEDLDFGGHNEFG